MQATIEVLQEAHGRCRNADRAPPGHSLPNAGKFAHRYHFRPTEIRRSATWTTGDDIRYLLGHFTRVDGLESQSFRRWEDAEPEESLDEVEELRRPLNRPTDV